MSIIELSKCQGKNEGFSDGFNAGYSYATKDFKKILDSLDNEEDVLNG